ncbi:MAG: 2-keto-3-deoxy-L-rhamnonate aldolase [Cypionkella sp.]|uniref:HpcH/HpaI aldolase family protein n=1 Tax=Cypionkella sp. TaxID=2811411 RepID=UPI00260CD6D9|nr:HpcH/HpaI aldolase/citrate lyase family protein [Cypionkella sp.]MDB5658916.1 2-keto-3-deoxy-L-rhamnonate aldolase [Cypionkella sp.]
MPAPINHLRAALAAKIPQFGIWLNLASPYSAELLSGCGFDWLLIDGEHGPNSIPTMLTQAQTIATRTSTIVRIPVGETHLIKQVLDLGIQTVMVPMIESVDHAKQMALAMKYPPEGVRGLGAAVARAADFGRVSDYLSTANAETCLILQIESRAGLAALPAILTLSNIECIFIGPSDLAADMGFPGNTEAPEVQAAIDDAMRQIIASGKAAGILTFDLARAKHYRDMGVTFLGIGGDIPLLLNAANALLAEARS